MDEIVEAALKKWPNVPHCRGWLALDARGDWYLRDDGARAAGPFPQVKGSRIVHDRLQAFIGRNYACDDDGHWFFQNGPQRVYVELEAAPWVWRLQARPDGRGQGAQGVQGVQGVQDPARPDAPPRVASHTGRPAEPRAEGAAWLDEHGRLFLETDLGYGIVHTLDMGDAADAIERGLWAPVAMRFADMPARFGYRLRPD